MNRKLLPFAVLAALSGGDANALLIDSFLTPTSSLSAINGPAGPTLVTGATVTVGNSRELAVTAVGGTATNKSVTVIAGGGELSVANGPDTTSTSTVVWDNGGTDVLGANLTDGGASNALKLQITKIDLGFVTLTFDITDTSLNTASLTLTGLGTGLHSFNFSQFTNFSGTSFSSVDIIQLTVVAGNDADLILSLVETNSFAPPPPTGTPEPATLSLFGMGLAAMAARRRRKA
ncbi:MAG: PEP-CTERM sorting domain-containing protein [Candidatus Methylumidiphilus sp.]